MDADPLLELPIAVTLITILRTSFRPLVKRLVNTALRLCFSSTSCSIYRKAACFTDICTPQCMPEQLPITMVATGLPQLLGQTGQAKSYSERLFEFVNVDRLSDDDARAALVVPANNEGVDYTCEAIDEILKQTCGYPYFLQEWASTAGTLPLIHLLNATVQCVRQLKPSLILMQAFSASDLIV